MNVGRVLIGLAFLLAITVALFWIKVDATGGNGQPDKLPIDELSEEARLS
jgi:hypothetical protein